MASSSLLLVLRASYVDRSLAPWVPLGSLVWLVSPTSSRRSYRHSESEAVQRPGPAGRDADGPCVKYINNRPPAPPTWNIDLWIDLSGLTIMQAGLVLKVEANLES